MSAANAVSDDPTDRPRRARAHLLRGRQKALAAETLWGHEQCAEAISLRRGALDEAIAAAQLLAGDDAPWTDALLAAGLSADAAAALRATHEAQELPALPAFDAQVGPAEDHGYAALTRAHRALDRALAASVLPREPRGALTVVPFGAVVTLLLVGGAVLLRHALKEVRTAVASAELAVPPGFPPAKALDGDATTEWLLPHGQTGWIDVQFRRPRALRAVRVLNAHNRTFNDLATHDYRIEAFAGDRVVGAARGSFPGINPAGPWARHPIAAAGVTRVRVWVDSFHGATGGLGEIDFE